MTEKSQRLSDFTPWRHWVADAGGEVFKTHSAFEWFVRRHRARLVESGQFIQRSGSTGGLVGPDIDRVVLEILRAEGARRLTAGQDQAA